MICWSAALSGGIAIALPRSVDTWLGLGLGSGLGEMGLGSGFGFGSVVGVEVRWFAVGFGSELGLGLVPLSI